MTDKAYDKILEKDVSPGMEVPRESVRDKMIIALGLIVAEPESWSFTIVRLAEELAQALEANRPEETEL